MPYLWTHDGVDDEWAALPLDGCGPVDLAAPRARRAIDEASATRAHAVLVPGPRGLWALLAREGADVRVNGLAVPGGLRVVADRDELRVGDRTLYFSSETRPRLAPFEPAGTESPTCPRCHEALAAGTSAVRCGVCGVACHQREDRPCWTYSDACPVCGAPTALDADLRWTPAEL